MIMTRFGMWVLAIACLASAQTLEGAVVVLSTAGQTTVDLDGPGGNAAITFGPADLVQFVVGSNGIATSATVLYNLNQPSLLGSAGDVDALYIRGNGNLLLSTRSTQTLGSVTFRAGDLVEFNPNTTTASLFLKGDTNTTGTDAFGNTDSVFRNGSGNPTSGDINGVDLIGDVSTQLLLSTAAGARLPDQPPGSFLSFNEQDIVQFNGTNDSSLFFTPTFTPPRDVDGVDLLPNGNLVLSVRGGSVTLGANSYEVGDLFEFNRSGVTIDGLAPGDSRLFFSRSNFFSGNQDIDAVHVFATSGVAVVPEPASFGIFFLGAIGLLGVVRRRKHPVANSAANGIRLAGECSC